MERNSRLDRVISVIGQSFSLDREVSRNTPLLSSGLIDSFGLVVLIGALEDEFEVSLDEAEIDVMRFDTPDQILHWLETGGS